MSTEETKPVYDRKLFNKGARVIRIHRERVGATIDPKTKQPAFDAYDLAPQKAGAYTKDEATKLLRLYKSELIDMENVTVESLTGSGAGDKLAADSKADAEAIAKRLADARHMRAEKAYEQARKEGFSDDEAREIAGLPPLTDEQRVARDALTSDGQKPPVSKE